MEETAKGATTTVETVEETAKDTAEPLPSANQFSTHSSEHLPVKKALVEGETHLPSWKERLRPAPRRKERLQRPPATAWSPATRPPPAAWSQATRPPATWPPATRTPAAAWSSTAFHQPSLQQQPVFHQSSNSRPPAWSTTAFKQPNLQQQTGLRHPSVYSPLPPTQRGSAQGGLAGI